MAIQTKLVKQKIKSVANIKKITKTMEMVSVSKMRRATQRTLSSRTYAILGLKLMSYLSTSGFKSVLQLPNSNTNGKKLIILFAGNKGLCGGYHVNLFKILNNYIKQNPGEYDVVTVGKYAEKICNKLKLNIIQSYIDWNESTLSEDLNPLSRMICEKYINSTYKNILVCYTSFYKSTVYKSIVSNLLPVNTQIFESFVENTSINGLTEIESPYDFSNTKFEPNGDDVLQTVVPAMINMAIYQCLAESHASEHSARMFAMKNAGDNASSMLDDLQLTYNNARQAGITQELSEIVGGASALQVD